jgi:hypothetical protein
MAPGRVLAEPGSDLDRLGHRSGMNAARPGAHPTRPREDDMANASVEAETTDRETLFRRTMDGATDILWGLRYHEEALSALQEIVEYATIQKEAGEDRRGDLSE